jgi:hypothetical protein
MIVRSLCLITLVLLGTSLSACQREEKSGPVEKSGAKSGIVGKWEATLTRRSNGNETKMLWEFLPDGTFTAAPLEDPGTIVDKDTYQIIEGGQKVKIRSQLVDNATCIINGSSMSGETPEYLVKFMKL